MAAYQNIEREEIVVALISESNFKRMVDGADLTPAEMIVLRQCCSLPVESMPLGCDQLNTPAARHTALGRVIVKMEGRASDQVMKELKSFHQGAGPILSAMGDDPGLRDAFRAKPRRHR